MNTQLTVISRMVIQTLDGAGSIRYDREKSGHRMPIISSHLYTPCRASNDTGFDDALSKMAGLDD